MTDKNIEQRLERIEQRFERTELAIAELVRWHRGDWFSSPGASAAGDILAEQRAADEQQQREKAVA